MLALLPVWKHNPTADFTGQVDSLRLFDFIEQVRTRDSVWVSEFRHAKDIADALRTQFAYQQQSGLRLQRHALGAAEHDWFDTLRGEALRLALDQPGAWEYLLFATALRDGVARHHRLARTHALKLPLGFGEDVREPLVWVRARISDAMRLTKTLTDLMNGALQDAFGPPGTSGDVGAIVFVADTIADLYRDALAWSLRLRTANVDDRFQRVMETVANMMDNLIEQIAAFGPTVRRQIDDALAAPKTGTPRILEMTLTVSIPEGAIEALNDELATLTRELERGR